MPTEPCEPDRQTPMDGAFDGRQAFHLRLRGALEAASQEGWRELVFSDPTFADWPLGERACIERLNAWAGSGRTLLLLASSFAVFDREHARFVQWRRTWSHIVDCRACSGAGAPRVPSAVWTPSWQLHRIDTERSRGISGSDPERRRALREQVDECLRHGRPAFPATTLGL